MAPPLAAVDIRNGIYYADGRSSNPQDVGRHSLGTRDRKEALHQLARLDLVKAVEFGLADRSLLDAGEVNLLNLEEGQQLYLDYVRRPPVLGGTEQSTYKRYRAVLGKFVPFAREQGVRHWPMVTKKLLEAYGAWLDSEGYGYATQYHELTVAKQILRWLVGEKLIPSSCLFALPLEKPQGTTTYCYTPEEVHAIVTHCFGRPDLVWLGEVIVALATTGLRIGELAELRWPDFDFKANMIRLTDTRRHARKADRAAARSIKTHRDRVLPIHPELLRILLGMRRRPDGRVFHGPKEGRLKPDTIRNVLIREVLTPLADRFPTPPGAERGFRDGRLHSFRHAFCSTCANSGVPELAVMAWLGQRDSRMVRHYYHLHQKEAQLQMAKVPFLQQPSQGVENECLRIESEPRTA